ncbi:unnamed protein product [Bursaphelenchus xylophilus]|uniref:(pine wood nematode) hypothetical protein n=1 Tax=Bursaphelenchus xylophilus TaxID=6326 RepID=A0A1I7SCD3_BURXY|nr:unnamed protein product [Bursaphelenchus xylophilus]CAG9094306.1 unnamed protein product [Bursaphelenchus xylophilus]
MSESQTNPPDTTFQDVQFDAPFAIANRWAIQLPVQAILFLVSIWLSVRLFYSYRNIMRYRAKIRQAYKPPLLEDEYFTDDPLPEPVLAPVKAPKLPKEEEKKEVKQEKKDEKMKKK